jgi:hypothetical protein
MVSSSRWTRAKRSGDVCCNAFCSEICIDVGSFFVIMPVFEGHSSACTADTAYDDDHDLPNVDVSVMSTLKKDPTHTSIINTDIAVAALLLCVVVTASYL